MCTRNRVSNDLFREEPNPLSTCLIFLRSSPVLIDKFLQIFFELFLLVLQHK